MRKITTSAYMPTEIEVVNVSENVAKIIAYPFEKGYGVTLAHPLRRLLFTSTVGFAPTALKIEGVSHEFDSMRGMLEDVAIFIINLKNLRFKLKGEAKRAVLEYEFSGSKEIYGQDLENDEVVVVNKDAYLATINEDAELKFKVIVEKGIGYVPSEELRSEVEDGFIALDAFFTPVKQAVYDIENVLVEDNPDYEKIVLTITTDGQVSPVEAFKHSFEAMHQQMSIFNKVADISITDVNGSKNSNGEHAKLFESIESLNLSARSSNCLEKAGLQFIGELALMDEAELKELKNLGKKSLEEIKQIMQDIGYPVGGNEILATKEQIRKKIDDLKNKQKDLK